MSASIQHTTNQSIKSFKSSEEYLYAMKEDLAEWLRDLYDIDIDVNNILETLETGAVLCSHANNVTRVAGEFIQKYGMVRQVQLPTTGVTFVNSAQPATFLARDNIANFINWCRKQMDVKDVLMFETEDLVLRKNEKNFVLCLLEVARRASRFGMAAPVLIQLEEEIEEEIREELDLPLQKTPPLQKAQRRTSNTQNLDEMVQHLISCCTCPTQFPMVKVSEGKYRVGDSSTLIFVRILRNHVMVRVGGGWDTLEHYLDKHDPCRCTSISHKLAQRPATPVHEIKGRLALQPDGPGRTQPTTFLLSRHAQTPLQPILWTPSAPSSSRGGGLRPARARASPSPSPDPGSRIQDPGPRASFCPSRGPKSSISPGPSPRDNICNQGPGLRRSGSPNYGPRPFFSPEAVRRASREMNTPSPSRLRPPTPTRQHSQSESHHDSSLNSTTRTGRAATRSSPGRSLTNSLPRPVQRPSTPQPQHQTKAQPQRPKTPLVFHRPPGQLSIHPQPQHQHQPKPESHLTQIWTKSQFASKLRQTSSLSANSTDSQYSAAPYRQEGSSTARPATPIRGYSPSKYTPVCPRQPTITVQEPKVGGHSQGNPDLISTFSPVKKSRDNSPGEAPVRAFTSMGGNLKEVQNKTCTPDNTMANPSHSSLNGDHRGIQGLSKQNAIGLPINHKASHKVEVGVSFDELDFQDHLELPDKRSGAGDGEMDKGYIFTPPPISPAQEASLYQSLEHEILANLQQLSMDSDDSHSNVTDDCTEISQYKPSELEHGRFKMDSVGSKSSPLNQKLSSKAAAANSSLPSEASYDTVITELSKGKRLLDKVCVESWVNTLSGSSRSGKMAKNRKEVDSDLNLEATQPCVTSSWSSLGSSVESKELPADSKSHRHSRNRVSISRRRPEANSTAVSPRAESTEPESQKKPRVSSFRQRRALKKPERVPSIYKLKLRPRVLPRHDYRPGKKPSRIPTPLSYRGNPPAEDPGGSSMDTHTRRQAGHSNTSHRQADRGRQGSTERDQRIETCRQPGYEATVRPTQCQTLNQDITDDTKYWV